MENPNTAKGNLLAHEVNIELYMLRTAMVHQVGGKVDRADVIAVDKSSFMNLTKQLLEQLTEQEHSATALATTRYSASALEPETVGCRFDDQEINEGPR